MRTGPPTSPAPSPVHWWAAPGPNDLDALREATASLPIAVVLVEAGAGEPPAVLAWNAACARLTGVTPPPGGSPFPGLPYGLYRPDRSTRLLPEELPGARAALSGEPVASMEVHLLRGDGEWRVLSASAAPVPLLLSSGRRRAVEVLLDQTEARLAEEQRSREELRALAARLDAVREEEKARIARDLHDDMGQLLTGLRVALDQVEESAAALPPDRVTGELLDRVVDASTLAGRAVTGMRQAVARLRPAALDLLGLVPALRQECREFQARARITCELSAPEELALGPDLEIALFRIAQEALTNVARHAGAHRVRLWLEPGGGAVVLRIADDGRGPPHAAERVRGLGLVGMRERAERLGGELAIAPGAEGGTVVTARIPLTASPGDPT